jgi:hypothetical protein
LFLKVPTGDKLVYYIGCILKIGVMFTDMVLIFILAFLTNYKEGVFISARNITTVTQA